MELRQQLRFLRPFRCQMGFLDMTIATNLFGDTGDCHDDRKVIDVQCRQQGLDSFFIACNRKALGHMFEENECTTAQKFQLGQRRRCQIKLELIVAFEHAGDLGLERAIGVQQRDLILIPLSHQLEQISCHRHAQVLGLSCALGLQKLSLRRHNRLDEAAVLLNVGHILIGSENSYATLDQVIQSRRALELDDLCRHIVETSTIFQSSEIASGAVVPDNSLLIESNL